MTFEEYSDVQHLIAWLNQRNQDQVFETTMSILIRKVGVLRKKHMMKAGGGEK